MANYISKITLPDSSEFTIRDRTLNIYSGSCATAAATEIKDVTCPELTSLTKGAVIFVTFTNTNTAAVTNLKLRVNSSEAADAKPIKHQYNASEANIPDKGYIRANQTYQFYYDGTNWVMVTDYNTDTWRGIQDNLTSSTNTTESLSAKQGYLLANGSARDNTKLEKITYEYNKEISFGASGKLLIGKFACYDTNITIQIYSTTSTTYYATAILATQNINTTAGGTFTWKTYGDSSNTVTPNLFAKYVSGSNVIEIYFKPASYSKNYIHISCISPRATPTNICESVDSIPEEATRQPTNTLLGSGLTTDDSKLSVNYGQSTAKIGTSSAGSATSISRSDHVHAIDLSTGDNDGQVKIAGTNISVKGLDTAAYHAHNNYVLNGGNNNNLGSGSPADSAKTYYTDNLTAYHPYMAYNTSGVEWSLLFTGRSTYGSILKWGYADTYIRILRRYPNGEYNGWYSQDWEKISAGYADSAGKATNDTDGNPIKTTYAKLASPIFTGTPKSVTPTSDSDDKMIATKEYVDGYLAVANAMVFKGTLGTGGTITALPNEHNAGDTYRIITAGTWAGKTCEIGDLIICINDGTEANNADWTSVETNEDGAVIGPNAVNSTSNNAIVRWNSTTGRVIKNSNVTIDDNSNISGLKSIKYSTRLYQFVTAYEHGQWHKITLPYANTSNSTSNRWFMCSFDLHIGGGYSANPSGIVHIVFYWYKAANNGGWAAPQVAAKADGILMDKINLYYRLAEPGILYVHNASNGYNGIWIDNLYVDDNAPSYDWTTTTITSVSAITESTDPKLSDYIAINIVRTYSNDGTLILSNHTEPYVDNTYNFGASNKKWATIYATTFNGNATSADKFASNATVTLTGDTTGESNGSTKSWSVATTTSYFTRIENLDSDKDENNYTGTNGKIKFYTHTNSTRPLNCPSLSYNSGLLVLGTSRNNNDTFQIEYSCNTGDIYTRSWLNNSTDYPGWTTLLNSTNYTTYAVKKDGTNATGKWSISTSGKADTAGTADKATAANLTTTENAIAYYTNTTGTFGSKASANGALYATDANGSLSWGTLPIAQGGTGATTAAAAWTALGGGDSGKHADSYFALASHGTHVPTSGTTAKFLRGDNAWSDTLIGPLNVSSSNNNRANINMISDADVPNDFYLGSNKTKHWSITSRDSSSSYNLLLFSTASSIGTCVTAEYSTGNINFSKNISIGGTLTASGVTSLGTKSQYYQRSTRGQIHHELIGSDADYGAVKIRHLSAEGSGGPGAFSATLGIFDERAVNLTGAHQPILYIKRIGTVTVNPLIGADNASGRVFTVTNAGQVEAVTFSGPSGACATILCKGLVSTSTKKVGTDTNLTTGDSDAEWLKALLKAICANYEDRASVIFRGKMSPNSEGYYEVCIYNTSVVNELGLPRYSYGTFRKYSNSFWSFGTNNYEYYCTAISQNGHTHNYAGSSSAGGAATSANAANITSTQYGLAYYSNTTGTFSSTGAGTSGQYLKSNGDSAPTWETFSSSTVGLGNVENTALSTWKGTSNITTLGTITTGVWNGTAIPVANGGTGATTAADARTNLGVAAASHEHSVSELTWGGGVNLKPTATANNQEWSIDLTPGSYTGTYWHVWSAKQSATILGCYTDDRHITMPGGIASTSTSTGTLQVTGGIGATGQVTALRLAANGSNTNYSLYSNGASLLTYNAQMKFEVSADNPRQSRRLTEHSTTSYKHWIILLLPYQTATNTSINNFIDGNLYLKKSGGNIYDKVYISANLCYNVLYYVLNTVGGTFTPISCTYNGVKYFALQCYDHDNPWTQVWFDGYCVADYPGGNITNNKPLSLPYMVNYKGNGTSSGSQTIVNAEVNNSISTTLTDSIVTTATRLNWKMNIEGNASSATAANLTTTTNAIAYYTGTTGVFGTKASANGALYSTGDNAALAWGTLPVAQGGTGATTASNARTNLGLGSASVEDKGFFVWNGGNNNNLGSGSPAANAKTYYTDTMTEYRPYMVYNSSGVEWSLLFTGRKAYGSILKWGYNDTYIRILRRSNNAWLSEDWEKISAGYADTVATASNTTSGLYVLGVTGSATTSIKRNTSIIMTGGDISATSMSLSGTTDSTSSSTGTLKVAGGVQVGKNIYLGHAIKTNTQQTFFVGSAQRSSWYKITLPESGTTAETEPPSSSLRWWMHSMTINVGGDYNNGPKGQIELSYYIYWDKTKFNFTNVYATAIGSNLQQVKIYATLEHPFDIYIYTANSYSSIWVSYLHGLDSAASYDTSATKVETASAITVDNYTEIPMVYFGNKAGSKTTWTTWNNIVPSGNNSISLGTSDLKWSNVYATNFNGVASSASAANLTTTANAVAYYTNTTGTFGTKASANGALYATSDNGTLNWGTLPVAQGGTGATEFTANSLIMSGSTTTAALTTRAIYDRASGVNALNAAATWADSTAIPTLNTLARWDGRYQTTSNKSNLKYCIKGEFGDACTKGVTTETSAKAISSTDTNLLTGQTIYYGLPTINNAHNYTSSTTIYAPTGGGTAGQVLVAVGATSTPGWNGGLILTGTAAASWKASFEGTTEASATAGTEAVRIKGGLRVDKVIRANQVYNAVWNDYAEYRESEISTPGACMVENDNGRLTIADERLIPGACIISDTYGFCQGETEKANVPIAVTGRVLAYTYWPREMYHAGMAVCSAPNGTIDIMTREEIRDYPDAIVGIVSEIPEYEYWGSGNVEVNGRIWIKVK